MRHALAYRKLGRTTAHRLALFRNMVTQLIVRNRITTTLPKAKEVRRWAEWVVTLAKTGTLRARRRAAEIVQEPAALVMLFGPLAERFRARAGGYTRIVRLGIRHGDAAQAALLEYLPAESPAETPATKAKQSGRTKAMAKPQAAPAKARKVAK
ncbi:MAG: 50S ribosomal protein L17 [Deltaproteobacteria bacterium]|nr:50S ribosomal protein L17 [Deltaproteobacteria bacterium]